jgi:hypothetical protein
MKINIENVAEYMGVRWDKEEYIPKDEYNQLVEKLRVGGLKEIMETKYFLIKHEDGDDVLFRDDDSMVVIKYNNDVPEILHIHTLLLPSKE